MTKMHLPAPAMRETARPRRPWLLTALLAALVAYVGWVFVKTPMLAGALLGAFARSLGF